MSRKRRNIGRKRTALPNRNKAIKRGSGPKTVVHEDVFVGSRRNLAKKMFNAQRKRMARPKMVGRNIPVTFARPTRQMRSRNFRKDSENFSGQFVAQQLQLLSTNAYGDMVAQIPIQANNPNSQLLTFMSSVYEKWQLISLRIQYLPQVGTSEQGNFMMYWDPDIADVPNVGVTAYNNATENGKAVDFPVYEPTNLTVRPEKKDTDRYTNDDSQNPNRRLTSYGQIVVLAGSNAATTKTMGKLVVHYKIRFYKRQLEQQTAVRGGVRLETNNPAETAPFGSSVSQSLANGTNFSVQYVNPTNLKFNVGGSYLIMMLEAFSSGSAINNWNVSAATGGTVINGSQTTYKLSTATIVANNWWIVVINQPTTVSWSRTSGTGNTGFQYEWRIVPYSSALNSPKPELNTLQTLMEKLKILEDKMLIRDKEEQEDTDEIVVIKSKQKNSGTKTPTREL